MYVMQVRTVPHFKGGEFSPWHAPRAEGGGDMHGLKGAKELKHAVAPEHTTARRLFKGAPDAFTTQCEYKFNTYMHKGISNIHTLLVDYI